jgi:hypothetical protein
MKRWRNTGAFLLTLALLGEPLASAQGKRQERENRGGRAVAEQQQRGGRAQRQEARGARDRSTAKRAERANDRGREQRAQRSTAREQRQVRRSEQRAERAQRQDRNVERAERRDQQRERQQAVARRQAAEREQAERRQAKVARERAEARRDDDREERQRAISRQRANAQQQAAAQQRANTQRQRTMAEQRAEAQRQRRANAQQQRALAQQRADARRQAMAAQRAEERRRARAQAEQSNWRRERADQRWLPTPVRRDGRGVAARPQMRFAGQDRNGDGRISRQEWRGNAVSFSNHDWNRDGVLSGAEVVPGARRGVRDPWPTRQPVNWRPRVTQPRPQPLWVDTVTRVERLPRLPRLQPVTTGWTFDENLFERRLRVDGFAPVRVVVQRVDLTPIDRALVVERFSVLDADRDRYVSLREWNGPRPLFRQLDDDRDDLLVVSDFDDTRYVSSVRDVDRERYVTFHLLDIDDDGVVAPWEWTGDLDGFFLVDVDDDGVVSLAEFLGLVQVRQVPLRTALGSGLDFDGDGDVTAVEWWGDPLRFARLDIDADGELEPLEAFVGWLFQA